MMITMPRWKYLWNALAMFFAGYVFGHKFSAAGWFRSVITILVVLLFLGALAVALEANKKMHDRKL